MYGLSDIVNAPPHSLSPPLAPPPLNLQCSAPSLEYSTMLRMHSPTSNWGRQDTNFIYNSARTLLVSYITSLSFVNGPFAILLFFWAASQELCSKLLPYTEGKMYCHEESALKLAAYALQAEKGDHQPTYKNNSYFRLEDYVPEKVSPRNKFTRLAAKTGPFLEKTLLVASTHFLWK